MILLIIPLLIIVGALGFFYLNDIIQGLDFSLPALNTGGESRTSPAPSGRQQPSTPPPSQRSPEIPTTPQPNETPAQPDPSISPFEGKILITRVVAPRSNRTSLVTITARLDSSESVSLTNWRIDTIDERYFIPQGVAEFAQSNTGAIPKGDIVLFNGTTVHISSGHNPIANNVNYRVNQCLREFKDGRNFPISVPGTCTRVPKPSLREISNFSVACQDYILRNTGRSCVFPDFAKERTVASDTGCFLYLKHLKDRYATESSYEYCYQQHADEEKFFSNIWHVYTEGVEILREGHDRMILYDKEGRFVDEYLY